MDEGADIIDIGAESTKPGSKRVSYEEEKKRLFPIIDKIINIMIKQKINPNSSPATAKIKSVLASGILSFKIPCPGPLPNNPPFWKAFKLRSI